MNNNKKVKETLKQSQEESISKKDSKKKEFYKKWWFWLIIAIILTIFVFCFVITDNKNTYKTSNITNTTNKTNNSVANKTKTNPYKTINNYDGVYKFILNSDNGSGHTFTSKGAISFNNGICKAKYLVNSDTISEYGKEYEGFCGVNENDNSNFYFSLNNDEILYQCIMFDKNFSCKLKSKYDLSGCYSDELILTYVDNSQDIDKVLLEVKEEENAKKEEQFKESCQTYTFEQIARNPDNFKGTNVKLIGEVIQVMSDSYSTNLRVNITKTGTYSTYYTDTIYVVYCPKAGEDKILEDDIITIYGTSQGDCSYTTVLGSTVTLPNIKAEYITINK